MQANSFEEAIFITVYESPIDGAVSVIMCDVNKEPVQLLEHCESDTVAQERKEIYADYYGLHTL
jgi:hypothetical protein